MAGFGWVVHKVIEKSDIVLEILDARFINETRNKEIEYKVKNRNKILVYVVNKCDYANKKDLLPLKKQLENCVFVSATKHLGTSLLKQKIKYLAKKNKIEKPIVGVIGYPNVGKSSLINALKGKGSAKTSPEPGYTKGVQILKISENMKMLDTPGVISREDKGDLKLAIIGAKNPSIIEDPDLAVIEIMKKYPNAVEKYYSVKPEASKEDTIDAIALKLNMKKKGNLPDTERASRKILYDWQSGKIKKTYSVNLN